MAGDKTNAYEYPRTPYFFHSLFFLRSRIKMGYTERLSRGHQLKIARQARVRSGWMKRRKNKIESAGGDHQIACI